MTPVGGERSETDDGTARLDRTPEACGTSALLASPVPQESGRRIAARFSAADAAVVDGLAARLGLSPSAVLRAGVAALAAEVDGRRAAVPGPPTAVEQALIQARMEVRRIGVNVNQVTRKIHRREFGEADDADLLLSLVEDLTAAIEAVGA